MKTNFPFNKQPDAMDCGPSSLRIFAKHYGKLISLREISEAIRQDRLNDAFDYQNFQK